MVNFQHIAVGVVVGGIDETLERVDVKAGRTGNFKTWRDYARIGLPALGILAQVTNKYAALGDAVATASLPLLTKSVAKVVMPETTTTAATRAVARMANRVHASPAAARASEFDAVQLT